MNIQEVDHFHFILSSVCPGLFPEKMSHVSAGVKRTKGWVHQEYEFCQKNKKKEGKDKEMVHLQRTDHDKIEHEL